MLADLTVIAQDWPKAEVVHGCLRGQIDSLPATQRLAQACGPGVVQCLQMR